MRLFGLVTKKEVEKMITEAFSDFEIRLKKSTGLEVYRKFELQYCHGNSYHVATKSDLPRYIFTPDEIADYLNLERVYEPEKTIIRKRKPGAKKEDRDV